MVKRQGYEVESNFDGSGKPGTAMIWKANLQVLAPPQPIEARTTQMLKVRDERVEGSLIIINLYAPSGSAGKGERAVQRSTCPLPRKLQMSRRKVHANGRLELCDQGGRC